MDVHALVIGNNNYQQGAPLDNAINDAAAIANKFKHLSCKTKLITNFTYENIATILSQFKYDLNSSVDIDIFYFAGHAFEIDYYNYIAPIDCPFSSGDKANCKYSSLRLNDIIDIFESSNCSVKIIILVCNGINVADLVKLRYSNIIDGEICFIRQKTERTTKNRKEIRVVIAPELQTIIDKWGNTVNPNSFIFPYMNDKVTALEQKAMTRDLIK